MHENKLLKPTQTSRPTFLTYSEFSRELWPHEQIQ